MSDEIKLSGIAGQRPAVTVITPTKNRLPLLCEMLDSVAANTFVDWEHIVIDDGSDDGTHSEMALRCKRDPRVRFIVRKGERTGANVCRNIGIHSSRADLVVFLDSDDVLLPSCLGQRVQAMRQNRDIEFAIFRGWGFESTPDQPTKIYHSNPPGDDLLRFLSHECIWEITSPIWRRNLLVHLGGFDEHLLSMQDLELHVRAICTGAKYVTFPDIDHAIRWQFDKSKTSTRHFNDERYILGSESVRVRMLESLQSNNLLTWSRRRAITGLRFNSAEQLIRQGYVLTALRLWTRSFGEPKATFLFLSGYVMLTACCLTSGPESWAARLVNKWKGWVRFRPEPYQL